MPHWAAAVALRAAVGGRYRLCNFPGDAGVAAVGLRAAIGLAPSHSKQRCWLCRCWPYGRSWPCLFPKGCWLCRCRPSGRNWLSRFPFTFEFYSACAQTKPFSNPMKQAETLAPEHILRKWSNDDPSERENAN